MVTLDNATRSQLRGIIRGLKNDKQDMEESYIRKIKEKDEKHTQAVSEYDAKIKEKDEKHTQAVSEYDAKIEVLEEERDKAKEESTQKQKLLDKRELKKLALAYEEEEIAEGKSASKWLRWLTVAFFALLVSALIPIALLADQGWLQRLPYYSFDIIFIGMLWFCGAQYAGNIKRRNDYANRKAIAQSFHNILNNLPEDEPIRGKFIEKATEVLCAPSVMGNGEPILSKKLMKEIAEIAAVIVKKG